MDELHPRFGRRPGAIAASTLEDLRGRVQDLRAAAPSASGPLWGAVHKALLKAKVDAKALLPIVGGRDIATLEVLVRWLTGEAVEMAPVAQTEAPTVDIEVQRSAMRAYRKRLRLARLDAESRLGVGPMSTGKRHEIDAIIPPREYPLAVWEALVTAGRLRREGGGFYALVQDDVGDD